MPDKNILYKSNKGSGVKIKKKYLYWIYIKKAGLITKATTDITVLGQVAFTLCWRHYVHVILCNFRSLFYFIYISLNSWYLNKPDEDRYWPVEISQLNSISRCLISPCRSLLDCNVFNFICFDWSRSFWILRWARLFVHGFFSVFFYLNLTQH